MSRERETNPRSPVAVPDMVGDILHGRLFLDDTTKQGIAIFDAAHGAGGRVMGIWRTLRTQADAWPNLLTRLTDKYGKPAKTGTRYAVWANLFTSATTTGGCLGASEYGGQLTWKAQPMPETPGGFSGREGDFPTMPLLTAGRTYDGCGPVLMVRAPSPMPDDATVPLETHLFDLGIISLISKHSETTSTTSVPPIRF